MKALASLSDLIFPSRCLGCLNLGIRICSLCRVSWHPHIYRTALRSDSNSFQVYSSVQYSQVARRVLLGAKEDALKDADELIAQALAHSLSYLYSEVGIADLVPIPSRKSAVRKRGRDFILDQTLSLSQSPRVSIRTELRHLRRVKDQSTLTAAMREANLQDSLICANSARGMKIPVIIVDDLVTTGATLREAARALSEGGYQVIGAVTACVAKPLRYDQ